MDNEHNSLFEKYDEIVETYKKLIQKQSKTIDDDLNLIHKLNEMNEDNFCRFIFLFAVTVISLMVNLTLIALYIKK